MAMRSAREIRGLPAGSDEDDLDLTSTDCEMVLSKDEFDMLQAFHRFVPLPALTSRILRVLCEDDLQVPEASPDDAEDDGSEATNPPRADQGRQSAISQTSTPGNILRGHPCRPSNLRKKPHYQINLTAQTPRIQQQQQQQPASSGSPSSSRGSTDSERSERPESQG
ncbi:hypothetical protein PHYPSEUDO_005376 [Phytophthora pseudosyringae]|uniref:Uncharacterized protein n=1 Tax=Phytophthora pseudosyringae TaxID=221518 RepID=A0A8T1VL38_9STRA|nr:hypothetical protein PHYPSEUDO_005376 [Phytophthora pseudosyringae]